MTLKELNELLETTGLPVAYREWPDEKAPPLPFICYLVAYSNNFGADNTVYYPINHMQIELYTELKDPIAEGKVEKALSSFYWEKRKSTSTLNSVIKSFMKLRCKKWQEKTRLNLVLKMCITRY